MASPSSFNDSYAHAGPGNRNPELSDVVHPAPTEAEGGSPSDAAMVFPQSSLPFSMIRRGPSHTQESRCEEVKAQVKEEVMTELRASIELLRAQSQKELEQKDAYLKQVTFERDTALRQLELMERDRDLEKREKTQLAKEMEDKLAKRDEDLVKKDIEIKRLKAHNEDLEKKIEKLTNEKEQLERTVKEMEVKMEQLNQSVTNIQNQSCVMKDELSAKMHEMEERTDHCLDEKVDKKVEEKIGDAVKMQLAEILSTLAVSNTASQETAQMAAAAAAKLQDYKRLSPKSGSHTPSPSRSPANVPTPPAENEQVQ